MRRFLYVTSSVLLSLILLGCSTPIEYVVMQEKRNENGFDVHLGYHTKAPFILAKVDRELTLKVNGAVVKKLKLSFWEWFKMGTLPATNPGMPAAAWQKVSQYAGKPFFLFDQIRAGPAGPAVPPPNIFEVIITSVHKLHTDGTIRGEGGGRPGDFGTFGYLNADQSGTGPSAQQLDGSGAVTQDDTAAWRARNSPQGNIVKPGNHVLTLTLTHKGGWAKNLAAGDWQVDWEYDRKFGKSELHDDGGTGHSTPASGP